MQFFNREDELLAEFGNVTAEEEDSLTVVKVKGAKLIGFETTKSLTVDEPQIEMIKSIAPILDETNCEYAAADLLIYETISIGYVAGAPQKSVDINLSLKDWEFDTPCAYSLELKEETNIVSLVKENDSWKLKVESGKD